MNDVINNIQRVFHKHLIVICQFYQIEFKNFQKQKNTYHDVSIARDDNKALIIIDRFALNIFVKIISKK